MSYNLPSFTLEDQRKNIMGLNNMINEPPHSNFQFMPTLGNDLEENARSGIPSPIPEDITKTMGLNNMIEDLEQMQQQKDARRREKAKQQRMAISFTPYSSSKNYKPL
ncbi:Uncharacterized protein Fot_42620 [Forsythia ovata]|uniref:Uncharacterized protein n=1 Tax=Forsythia ovata TaxID=205694 RepID=A0ABD1RLP8_9LAMI